MKQLLPFLLLFCSCHVVRAYRFRKFELDDVDKLHAVQLPASKPNFQFAVDTARYPRLTAALDSQLAHSQTYAFLVIRHDTILYERYFGTVTESTRMPSFSVAKSVTATLVGRALEEGFIKSLDQPVTDYLPQLARRDERFRRITIQHVLDMRSGVRSSEDYGNPFSDVLKLGFAGNVSKPVLRLTTESEPGAFDYKSVNTQLLAMIVEKATGKKLHEYFLEKLWNPLGMEHPGNWNADRKNTVRAFCCLNLAGRDFARFGRLYLRGGDWEGKQLISREWVERSVSRDSFEKYDGYHNQWWAGGQVLSFYDSTKAVEVKAAHPGAKLATGVNRAGKHYYRVSWSDGAYHAEGILGQYIYVNPKKDLVIVRLGHYWSHPRAGAEDFIYALGASL